MYLERFNVCIHHVRQRLNEKRGEEEENVDLIDGD
jgi:hypothetical protein